LFGKLIALYIEQIKVIDETEIIVPTSISVAIEQRAKIMETLKMKVLAAVISTLATGIAFAAPIYGTDWAGADTDPGAGFQGQGTITTSTSTVHVTYINPNGIGFYNSSGGGDYWVNSGDGRNDAISPYTSTVVDNSPTGTDIVALQYAGTQTLQFSQAIANPVFAFVSLNGNGYAFDQDFEILSLGGVDGNACGYWGCGGATKVVVDLGGGNFEYQLNSSGVGGSEPHGALRFTGAFDTVVWRSSNNEYWNGFTVGVQGTAAEVFPDPDPNPAPEPATLALLGLGLAGLGIARRRKA